MTTPISIDLTLLEKLKHRGDKIIARCPACAAEVGDRRGEHLYINASTGQWGCAAFSGDAEHRKAIFALVGIRGERPPERPEWREARRKERQEAEARARLAKAARVARAAICERWEWLPVNILNSSPTRIDCELVMYDPRHFIQSLFPQDSVIWTGELNETGTWSDGSIFPHRWKPVSEWQVQITHKIGPMVSPATWPSGTLSRSGENVLTSPYTVLDFDELDGKKPETPAEIEEHVAASLAICRWLREGLCWQLAAILHTGNKSLHCWFHNPGTAALQSLRDAAGPLGIDPGLIGRPEHPARLPGQRHKKSGNLSFVLWLQHPVP